MFNASLVGCIRIKYEDRNDNAVMYFAKWKYVGPYTISTVLAEGCETMGKVSGGKMAKAGTKLTLKATPNKGYVFAGWYLDAGCAVPCDSSLTDYRNPSYSYTVGEEDKTFYARFVPVSEDTNLNLTVDGVAISPDDDPLKSFVTEGDTCWQIAVDSLSIPKVSVKGLPAGMKFTDKPVYRAGGNRPLKRELHPVRPKRRCGQSKHALAFHLIG